MSRGTSVWLRLHILESYYIRICLQCRRPGVRCLGLEDPLETGKATHSSIRLENSMDRGTWWATVHGLQRVGHDWATNTQQYIILSLNSLHFTDHKKLRPSNPALYPDQVALFSRTAVAHTCPPCFRPPTPQYWRRKWQPTPVFLPREPCGQRSLVGCCPWGRTESDMTEAT